VALIATTYEYLFAFTNTIDVSYLSIVFPKENILQFKPLVI